MGVGHILAALSRVVEILFHPALAVRRMILKRTKRMALRTLRTAGLFSAIRASEWRRQRLLVIGYHGVSIDDEHRWDPAYYVTPDALEERFRALRDGGYNVLPLGEAVQRLASNTLPPRSVVLTFDDGLADFALNAYPLLKAYDYPATVYLSTYYTTDNRPVFGMFCSYVLWKARGRILRAKELLPQSPDESWNLGTSAGRAAAHQAVMSHAESRNLTAAEKDDLARQLATAVGVDYESLVHKRILRQVTPDEVSALSRAGIDFQLHTHRHRTPRDPELFGREVVENRACLRQMTGITADHFCYPSGVYHPEFLGWLRNLGVRSATTCDTGIATVRTDPMVLPRLIDTSNLELVEFEAWTTGIGALLPRRPRSFTPQ
jgi:peptidoglycan/xylan/chitin deacetylase (PgdA/CDA1 family)